MTSPEEMAAPPPRRGARRSLKRLKLRAPLGRFQRNALWAIVLRAANFAGGLLVVPLLARYLSVHDYGLFAALFLWVSLAGVFLLAGFTNLITQHIARRDLGVIKWLLTTIWRWSFLGSAFLACVAAGYALSDQMGAAEAALLVAVLYPFTYGLEGWKAVALGDDTFDVLGRAGALLAISRTALLLWVFFFVPPSLLVVVFVYLLPVAAQNMWQFGRVLVRLRSVPTTPLPKAAFNFGSLSSAYSSVNALAGSAERLLLAAVVNPEALALLTVAEKIPETIKTWLSDAAQLFSARFARLRRFRGRLVRMARRQSVVATIGIGLLGLIGMPYVVPVLFGPQYHDATLYSQVLMLSLAVAPFSIYQGQFIAMHSNREAMNMTTVLPLVIRLVLLVVAVPAFGLSGAVATIVLARLAAVVCMSIAIRRWFA